MIVGYCLGKLYIKGTASAAWIFFFVTGYGWGNINFPGTVGFPSDVGYPLWVVYMVWISVIFILYYPCKWYGRYKASHPEKKWLSYL